MTTLNALLLAAACLGAEPSVEQFGDGAKHYRDGSGKEEYERYSAEQVSEIANNILLMQRDNGGWTANWDPQRVLSERDRKKAEHDRSKEDTTFDNRATYPQIEYLAQAHAKTGDERYGDAAIRGLEFMLRAQHPCGGFPHSWPNKDNYRPYITFMDDVTVGAIGTLRNASTHDAPYKFIDDALRDRLREAWQRGVDCILKLQLQWEGKPAVWAGQYDPETLLPVGARPFEPAGFVSSESARVVSLLMSLQDPDGQLIAAIDGAVAWFKHAAIKGHRLEVFDIEPVRFMHHTAKKDTRLVPDENAPLLWARFYEFDTMRPFMANRDGKKVYDLQEVDLERRSGYSWYGGYAQGLLELEYPAWRSKCIACTNIPLP